ncbi:hypothetical protein CHISP_0892 [Chitinispirillum alkaliphilum]|nr:hypothetical protein CHISP_0892 [Chitinispirillum alkaliphilum]
MYKIWHLHSIFWHWPYNYMRLHWSVRALDVQNSALAQHILALALQLYALALVGQGAGCAKFGACTAYFGTGLTIICACHRSVRALDVQDSALAQHILALALQLFALALVGQGAGCAKFCAGTAYFGTGLTIICACIGLSGRWMYKIRHLHSIFWHWPYNYMRLHWSVRALDVQNSALAQHILALALQLFGPDDFFISLPGVTPGFTPGYRCVAPTERNGILVFFEIVPPCKGTSKYFLIEMMSRWTSFKRQPVETLQKRFLRSY